MSPSQAIAVLLANAKYGTVPQTGMKNLVWPIFISSLPDKGYDDAIAIYDTTGVSDGRLMENGQQIIHPGCQVRIRSSKYSPGWDKAQEIGMFFDSVFRQQIRAQKQPVVGSDEVLYTVHSITRRPTIAMGREQEGTRQNFSINIVFTWSSDVPILPTTIPIFAGDYLEVNGSLLEVNGSYLKVNV